MTIRVMLSDILRVGLTPEIFHKEMRDWRAHMAFVDAEKHFHPVPPEKQDFGDHQSFMKAVAEYNMEVMRRHQPYPGPQMHPGLGFIQTPDAEPFYEIIDDVTAPGAQSS